MSDFPYFLHFNSNQTECHWHSGFLNKILKWSPTKKLKNSSKTHKFHSKWNQTQMLKTTNLHKYKKEIRRVYKFNKALHYSLSILRTRALTWPKSARLSSSFVQLLLVSVLHRQGIEHFKLALASSSTFNISKSIQKEKGIHQTKSINLIRLVIAVKYTRLGYWILNIAVRFFALGPFLSLSLRVFYYYYFVMVIIWDWKIKK